MWVHVCISPAGHVCACVLQRERERENYADEVNGMTGLLQLLSLGVMETLFKWLLTNTHNKEEEVGGTQLDLMTFAFGEMRTM